MACPLGRHVMVPTGKPKVGAVAGHSSVSLGSVARSSAGWCPHRARPILEGLMGDRLVLVFGGPSAEHEVSLASASAVLSHLTARGWDVFEAGVTQDGTWLVGSGALEALLADADPARMPSGVAPVRRSGSVASLERFDGPPPVSVFGGRELAFLACHGRWGEDGTAQGLFGSYGIKIVGCGVAASAACFDKRLTKRVLAGCGLPVTKGIDLMQDEFVVDPVGVRERSASVLGEGRWFVKPARSGSSLGISVVERPDQLDAVLPEAFRWDETVLVEEYVPHRELVVGVIGREQLTVSPLGECVPVGPLYTYAEKYKLGNPRFTCPARVEPEVSDRVRELAARAYRALGCAVMARVDVFVDTRTGALLVNEVNTIPGLTEVSVFPKVMAAAGYGYADLLEELCRLADA
ncbi:MAG: D-alanine--D-alanine ligase [Streptosporangiales bacterium]|nr:D-alanine--D-alanine ligase [Streptosporangiales bacterium]